MEIIFLYNRLLGLSKKQLDAIRKSDFDLMEELTRDRENVTAKICALLDNGTADLGNELVGRKAGEITGQILDLDEEIKDALLDELFNRTIEISNFELKEE